MSLGILSRCLSQTLSSCWIFVLANLSYSNAFGITISVCVIASHGVRVECLIINPSGILEASTDSKYLFFRRQRIQLNIEQMTSWLENWFYFELNERLWENDCDPGFPGFILSLKPFYPSLDRSKTDGLFAALTTDCEILWVVEQKNTKIWSKR